MPHSYGYRARTRGKFNRRFRKHGLPGLSTYLHTYKIGDLVDIHVNSAIHKGMPHKFYHGHTGRVWNVTRRAIGVEINKQVKNKLIRKRIHIRVEHISPSNSRKAFEERVREINRLRRERAAAIKRGEKPAPLPSFKRLPEQPKPGLFVRRRPMDEMETVNPARFVNVF